jgi:hypothetical protein
MPSHAVRSPRVVIRAAPELRILDDEVLAYYPLPWSVLTWGL